MFARKLMSVVCGVKPQGKKWMQWAEKEDQEITGVLFRNSMGYDDTEENADAAIDFSNDLMNALVILCEDEPADLINNILCCLRSQYLLIVSCLFVNTYLSSFDPWRRLSAAVN